MSPMVQKLVKELIIEEDQRKPKEVVEESTDVGDVEVERQSYFDMERQASQEHEAATTDMPRRLVDVSYL